MNNQQPNVVEVDIDEVDIIFRRIKIIFFFSLLQLILSGGMIYFNYGTSIYVIIESICALYSILLIYWAYDQNSKTIQAQQQRSETTNNFSTRFQLVFSVTLTVIIIYTYMAFLLISLEQSKSSDIFNFLIVIGFLIQILVQTVILITNSYFCKSPNVLRLGIYFQCLAIAIVILLSWIRNYQVQSLPTQLSSTDQWVEWNTIIQIPTLILASITMLFNYIGNKKAYNVFGTIFLLLSILHTMIGCLVIRNAQFWIPSNEQLPLRALHEDVINQMDCQKYVRQNECQPQFLLEHWEQNNEITCLNEQCSVKAIIYIKNLQISLGIVFLFEATLLFINTYSMYTISVKYQISKLLNPLTQKTIIIIYFLITITSLILLLSIELPNIKTQPSMNYKVESDFFPEFNQLQFININEQNNDCKQVGELIPITDIQAINCETTCDDYEFMVALSSENSQFQQLDMNAVKTFNQQFTNQLYKKNDFNQQIVIRGNKSQIINGLNSIQICTQSQQIDLIYEIDQKKQKQQRILQLNQLIQHNDLIDIELKFIDVQTNRDIRKGNFRIFKQFIQCSNIKDEPYFEESIQNNLIYNLKKGQQITVQFFSERYYQFCANYFVSKKQIKVYPLKRNKNLLNVLISWQENQEKPIYLIGNQNIGKQINCQVGGYFTGCAHIKQKQQNTYSMLYFQKYANNLVIFLQDYEVQNFNSQQLQLSIYFKDYYNIRQINYQSSKILKILCINKNGEINLLQEYDDSKLYPSNC